MSAMIVQFKDGTDYAQAVEYVPGTSDILHDFDKFLQAYFSFSLPGPWFDGEQDKKFQTAFTADALAAGYTLQEALALRKENLKKQQQTTATSTSPTSAGEPSGKWLSLDIVAQIPS